MRSKTRNIRRTASCALAVSLCLALSAAPAQALTHSVSTAAEKGSIPALGSLPRSPDPTWISCSFSAAESAQIVTGTLDPFGNPGELHPMSLNAGDSLQVTLTGDPGTDFDLFLYWPDYSGVDDFQIAEAAVTGAYPETLEFNCAWPGTYYLYVSAFSGSGDYTMSFDIVPADGAGDLMRLWGTNRYDTAIDVCQHTFVGGSSRDVVLASGMSYPDALSASALAGALGCPLLLTDPRDLPGSVATELQRLGANDVHIVGGVGAVTAAVESEIEAADMAVFRYAGTNRYKTAEIVARAVAALSFFSPPDTVFVARGDLFADALVAAPFAYSQGYPVLLTASDMLSSEAAAAIRYLGVDTVVILGGENAVGPQVETALEAIVGASSVVRVAGANRYQTAQRVASFGLENYWATASFVGVASGTNFPDALAGGAATGAEGGVLVLTDPRQLSSEARAFITGQATLDLVEELAVFGGSGAVKDRVLEQIDGVLQ